MIYYIQWKGGEQNIKKTYEVPTQVLFVDDEGAPTAGIAYEDKIICACCGSIFEINETEILQDLLWIDFSKYIK